MSGTNKSDANPGPGVQSGLSKKEPIGGYQPRTQNEKNCRPGSPTATKSGPFTIK